jgi:hypothetical protein
MMSLIRIVVFANWMPISNWLVAGLIVLPLIVIAGTALSGRRHWWSAVIFVLFVISIPTGSPLFFLAIPLGWGYLLWCTIASFGKSDRRGGGWAFGAFVCYTAYLIVTIDANSRIQTPPMRKTRSQLEQIGVAMRQYHDAYGCFPPAVTTDATGKPLHGWTVNLLPFMGQQGLDEDYRHDLPWDDRANDQFGYDVGGLFQSAYFTSEPVTHFSMLVGPGSVGEGSRCTRLEKITDGPDRTILIVETERRPVP